ncbi:MAG: hypothetical protein WCC92_14105 [Candidatus Korobacteraceae bacterium]
MVAAIGLASLTVVLSPWSQAKQGSANISNTTQGKQPTPVSPSVSDDRTTANDYSYHNQSPNGDTAPQWVLVIVGVVTAGFIGWQALETRRAAQATRDSVGHMERQTKILKKSVKAAKRSAKAATDNIVFTHRPRLVIRGIGLVPGKYVGGESTVQDDVQWQVQYIVANIGGTAAHITDSNLTITQINIVDGELFPEFPPYSERRDSMGVFTVKPGEHQEQMVVLDERPDTQRLRVLRKMVQSGSLHTAGTAYLLGFIQYLDDAGVSRRTAFFRHYDAQTERFRRDKYPETPDYYEYAD